MPAIPISCLVVGGLLMRIHGELDVPEETGMAFVAEISDQTVNSGTVSLDKGETMRSPTCIPDSCSL